MSGHHEGKNKKLLEIILIFLFLIIISLVITIVVINNHSSQTTDETTKYALSEELQKDDLSPADQVIKETSMMLQDPNTSNADIETYYDTVITNAINNNDTDLAIKIIIQKMHFIATTENDCAKAAEYVNSIDLQPYTAEQQQYLTSYVISLAGACDDQNLSTRWKALITGANDV